MTVVVLVVAVRLAVLAMAQPLTQLWSVDAVRAPLTLQPLRQPMSVVADCRVVGVWPARLTVPPRPHA
eukprot:1412297-Lingulodinium_polyedra.AAC.1